MKHELLTFTMNESWNYLHKLILGITDQEFFWEPVLNCWRIHKIENGSWTYDYEIPEPKPAPLDGV